MSKALRLILFSFLKYSNLKFFVHYTYKAYPFSKLDNDYYIKLQSKYFLWNKIKYKKISITNNIL